MRLKPEIANDLKQLIQEKIPGSTVYLFGSRADDRALGGDIDLLILSSNAATKNILRKIRTEFFKKHGWQKIDLINYTYNQESCFRSLIQTNCIQL